jgi:putative colanic acid biosynthesis acetyltransferase WcaF
VNSSVEAANSGEMGSARVYQNRLGLSNQAARLLWSVAWSVLYRPTPNALHAWRRVLLRLFGARIGAGAHPYPRCRIWAPWNLSMGDHSCLANDVDCYSVSTISLGDYAVVSQYSHLCSATHDYEDPEFRLRSAPILIGARAWVATGAFVGPGVTIGDGAVLGARSVALRNIHSWAVAAGNPAKVIKERHIGSV